MNTAPPTWAKSLLWSNLLTLYALRANRDVIPSQNGIYVFSKMPFANGPEGILYVGKATTLPTRLASYLGDPAEVRVLAKDGQRTSRSLKHAGKVQILMEAMHCGGHNVWVSWTCYNYPEQIEGALIEWLKPAYNTRMEDVVLQPGDPLPT